jgi:hypothetical protein
MEGKPTFQTTTTVPVLNVKVDFREDIRRFTWTFSSLDALRNEILSRYALDAKNNWVLKYCDEEEDLVTLASEEDLAEALQIMRRTKGILKIHLVKGKIWRPAGGDSSATAEEPTVTKPIVTAPIAATAPPIVVSPKELKIRQREEAKRLREELKLKKQQERAALKGEKHYHHHDRKEKTPRLDKHSARFVKDVGVQEGVELAPSASFVKTWRFRNEGSMPWPEGCNLIFVSRLEGDRMGAPESVPVPAAGVGQEVDVSVNMVAPTEVGRYVGYWRLAAADGKKFGHRVRVLINVVASSSSSSSSEGEEEEENKTSWGSLLAQLEGMGFADKELNLKLLHKHDCDMGKVVTHLLKKQQKTEKKASKAEAKQQKKDAKEKKKEAKGDAKEKKHHHHHKK